MNAAITASQDVHHNIDALLNWVNDTEVNDCNNFNIPFVYLVYDPANGLISLHCYYTKFDKGAPICDELANQLYGDEELFNREIIIYEICVLPEIYAFEENFN